MKVLEISLFLILTWAAQESQGGAPMEKTCCSEPDGCGDDYMCGKKTIPTSGDYEEDWGSIESIDVTSEPKIEIYIGRRKLKKHFKVSLTFKISLFYAFPNFFSEMLVMDMVGEVITWSIKNFHPKFFNPIFSVSIVYQGVIW